MRRTLLSCRQPTRAAARHFFEVSALASIAAVHVICLVLLIRPAPAAADPGEPRLALRPSRASDLDLLGARDRFALDPLTRARLVAVDHDRRKVGAAADSLTLAVLRVDFVRDDDPRTTGDGKFDLSNPGGSGLDRPPHDRAYFERHVFALRNYWLAASGGELRIGHQQFPAGETDAYTLPHVMAYYNPDTTEAGLDRRLAELLRDAVVAADPEVDYAGFDAVLIFHAGVGQDLLLEDQTPSDIPSAFLSFRELKEALAPDDPGFQGIPVDGGSTFIREGTWLPETEVQQGIEFSVLGVMVSLFGSQLGLPSLFNTTSGAPGIGDFGLMDQGAGNELGKLPAAPSAWSRFFLGFASPTIIRRGSGIPVRAALSGNGGAPPPGDQLALIPIDSREYYLIENRQQELDDNAGFTLIDSLGTIVGVEANEYDGAIPGSGLLIWHIDEEVIRAGLERNEVNANFRHRGVDLEEADGVQDIGIRPDGGFGLAADCYREGNATRFAPDTSPSTFSNRGHVTHIAVSHISASALLMTFDVGDDITQTGWPDSTGSRGLGLAGTSLAAADLDLDGGSELVFVTPGGVLFALGDAPDREIFPPIDFDDPVDNGAPPLLADLDPGLPGPEIVVASRSGVRVVDASGNAGVLSNWARVLSPVRDGGPIAISGGTVLAALADSLDTEGRTAGYVLHAWRDLTDFDGFPRDRVPARSNLAYDGTHLLFAAGSEIVRVEPRIGAGNPDVTRIPCPGSQGVWILPGAFPRTTPDDSLGLAVVSQEEGQIWLLSSDGSLRSGWPRSTGERHLAPPALADLDEDGRLDIVVPGEGRVWAFAASGALLRGWPAALDTSVAGIPLGAGPVVSDLDGLGGLEVVAASPHGALFAFDARGRRLDGFPLPGGDRNLGSPVLTDLDGDGDVELAVAASDGWLHAYDLAGPASRLPPPEPLLPVWPGYGGPAQSFAHPLELEPPGGAEPLVPGSELTIYPNPTRGQTRIRYRAESGSSLRLTILDATGRRVRELAAAVETGGLNEVLWDGLDADGNPVPSGIYVCHIEARDANRTVDRLRTIAVTR